jgi:hypothetical protein
MNMRLSSAQLGVIVVAAALFVLLQAALPIHLRPWNVATSWAATAGVFGAQGTIEVQVQKAEVQIKIDRLRFLNDQLNQLDARAMADEHQWTKDCGIATTVGVGELCKAFQDGRWDDAEKFRDQKRAEIISEIEQLETEMKGHTGVARRRV